MYAPSIKHSILNTLLAILAFPGLTLLGQSGIICEIDINTSNINIQCRQANSMMFDLSSSNLGKPDSLASQFYKKIEDLNISRNTFFLYSHSLYGSAPIYSDIAHTVIQKSILDSLSIPLIIITWSGWNPLYSKNQEIAIEKGKTLSILLRPFFENHFEIFSLHHSMGAKVLGGILAGMTEKDTLSKVFLVAPDIESSFLKKESANIQRHIQELHIFYSPNDVVLWLAEVINHNKRLGNKADTSQNGKLYFHDTRELDCILNNNHISWMTCPEIRKIIRNELTE